MTPKEYEPIAIESLRTIFPDCEVSGQWKPFAGEVDKYAPKPDIAVGPFAITRRYGDEYGNILFSKRNFIESLISAHNENLGGVGNRRLSTKSLSQISMRGAYCVSSSKMRLAVSIYLVH